MDKKNNNNGGALGIAGLLFVGAMYLFSSITGSNKQDLKETNKYQKEESYTKSKKKKNTTTKVSPDFKTSEPIKTPEPIKKTPAVPTPKKEKKYDIRNLYLINTKLIDKSIGQKYLLVKRVESYPIQHAKCTYNTNKIGKWCFTDKFKTLDKKNPATFVIVKHYNLSNVDTCKQYFSVKANINNKDYKKVYKLAHGTIDHNPSNKKKFEKFESTIALFEDSTTFNGYNKYDNAKSNYYTADEIVELNEKINKGKVKVKMRQP